MMNKKIRCVVVCVIVLLTCVTARAELLGAAGKTDITPETSVFLGGYGLNRRSDSIHDRLTARCLVLESNGKRIAFVSCDLVGLPRYRVRQIRAMVKSVAPENLIIAATHTHSGPDTLGQWGPDIRTSGVDAAWMNATLTKIAVLVDATARKLQPVTLKFAQGDDTQSLSKNLRIPGLIDPEIGVMQVVSLREKQPLATLVNFACHPDILNSLAVSADFPHWLDETVEHGGGGMCLFLNGALGGMITGNFDEATAPKGHNFAAAERIGTALGGEVLALLLNASEVSNAKITTQHRTFTVPLENTLFRAYLKLGVFPPQLLQTDSKSLAAQPKPNQPEIETEVNRIVIGPAEFLTLPGEVLPNIGLYLKRKMHGETKFLIGLASDELGYILTPEDYGLPLYRYETQVSIGPLVGPIMESNLLDLLISR